MNKLTVIAALSLSLFAFGDAADPSISKAIAETVEAETGWTVDELVDALYLINDRYNRDVQTETGRKAWFGKLSKTVIDTNALTRTEIYEEGYTWTVPWNKPNPKAAVAAANARLSPAVMTNGVPARLAAARLRRQAERETTNVVTKVISTGTAK